MRLSEILNEGIYDKGIFKCVFLGGIPASGKSYLANEIIRKTGIMPKTVNFDQFYEYLSKKHEVPIKTKEDTESEGAHIIRQRAKELTKSQVQLYLSGMLPLIVDTTAADVAQLVERMSVIRDHGYDIMMVYKKSNMDVSMTRAANRSRYVDPAHIKRMHNTEEFRIYELEKYVKAKGNHFLLLEHNQSISDVIPTIDKFFTSPIENPIGLKTKEELIGSGEKITPIPTANKWY
jgi:hypothetical protein